MITVYTRALINIRNSIKPIIGKWNNIDDTNCYAYALGIDLSREDIYPFERYNPGTFAGYYLNNPFSKDELLYGIERDLYILGIDYKEVDYDHELNKDEWLMAIMATSEFNYGEIADFHFCVKRRKNILDNGSWTHKQGFDKRPTNLDSRGKVIINPVDSIFETCGLFTSTKYEHIKTICLTKKQV